MTTLPTDPPDLFSATVLAAVRRERTRFVSLLVELASVESPTEDVEGQRRVQAILRRELESLDFQVSLRSADGFADHFLARPRGGSSGPTQLLVGHCDTVWPLGTLADMPVVVENGRVRGPGTFDMKSGLAQAVVALRTLRTLGRTPSVAPVLFVNTEEEVGSPTSRRPIAELARDASRAIILEPSYGPDGKVKTARKGVARFRLRAKGRSAHSGLEPSKGASAILALAHAVVELHSLSDLRDGTTVNVGVIGGGMRPNVVPAHAHAQIDVRTTTNRIAAEVARAIHALTPKVPGVTFEIEDSESAPPLERTERNLRLWETVRSLGRSLGMELEDTTAGGASDGNTTSAHAPTIDGMGAVGDGAHAAHEYIEIDPSLDRAALLALLLLAPEDGARAAPP